MNDQIPGRLADIAQDRGFRTSYEVTRKHMVLPGLMLLSIAANALIAAPPLTPEQEAITTSLETTDHRGELCQSPSSGEQFNGNLSATARNVADGESTPYRLVVRFLIIRRSDGTGGLDESLLHYYMRDLNYGFRDTPFRFVQSPEIVYIDNDTDYDDIPGFARAIELFNQYSVDGVIDHIVIPKLCNDCATGFNFAGDSGVRGNIIAYHRIGHPHSIVFPPHEMGHVFFLYHPYEPQFGTECTSGSNCNIAGDLVCDTPASPIVHGGNTTATGIFFGNNTPPCPGDPSFQPNTRLYMEAGWNAGHILRDQFSPGQIARMVNTLYSISNDLIGPARPDVLVDCDNNGLDDVDEILAGTKEDLGRDLVPDVCQIFPEEGDLLVSGMTGATIKGVWPDNKVRIFEAITGTYRESMWNGMPWVHQLRLGPDGLVYLVTGTVVQRLDLKTGRTVDNFADGRLHGASVSADVLFDANNDLLVLDNVTRHIRRYSGSDGSYMGFFSALTLTGMTSPKYMEYGLDGHIYVVGNGAQGNTIQKVHASTGQTLGSFITPGAGGLIAGQGLVFHSDGMLYVSNAGGNNVLRYDGSTGVFDSVFVSSGSGGLSNPHSLRFGPDGHLYVASRSTNSVKRYDGSTGAYLGDFILANTDGLDQPAGLLFVPPSPPEAAPADDCSNAPLIAEGVHPFDNLAATTDGPDEPTACDFFGDTGVDADIWACYTASETLPVTVSLCDSDYNTRLAIYEGCTCPVTESATWCDDDSCSGSDGSSLSLNVSAGQDYLIRIGGFEGAQGSGSLSIVSQLEACCLGNDPCQDLTPSDCTIAGGLSKGTGTTCAENICPPESPDAELILNSSNALVASAKNRFLSFTNTSPLRYAAVRVTFTSLPSPFDAWNGVTQFAQEPFEVSEFPGKGLNDSPSPGEPTFWAAKLGCVPYYIDWASVGTVHVYDEGIIPSTLTPGGGGLAAPAIYEVQLIDTLSSPSAEESFGEALALTSAAWADLAELSGGEFVAPDQSVGIFDILAITAAFAADPNAPAKTRADLLGSIGGGSPKIDGVVSVIDLLVVLSAFEGEAYPFIPGARPCE